MQYDDSIVLDSVSAVIIIENWVIYRTWFERRGSAQHGFDHKVQ